MTIILETRKGIFFIKNKGDMKKFLTIKLTSFSLWGFDWVGGHSLKKGVL